MDLSIIIPVYNSEKIIEDLIKQITFSVDNIKSINSYEIILIEDCSPDNSWEKIELISKKYNNVKGISLSENFGQHNAIVAGIKYSSGEKIITMDDDLQHSPVYIKNILEQLDKNFDVCYTDYQNRKHPIWKIIVSWLHNLTASYLSNRPYKLYPSSFRGFKKKIALEIISFKGANVYIDGLILKITKNITIIPVEHYQRPYGSSNYNFKKLVSLWLDTTSDLKIFPLRLSSIFVVIVKPITIFCIKLTSLVKKKRPQYIIRSTTFVKK